MHQYCLINPKHGLWTYNDEYISKDIVLIITSINPDGAICQIVDVNKKEVLKDHIFFLAPSNLEQCEMHIPLFKKQLDMFLFISKTRPAKSEISGKPLLPTNNMRWHHQFMHVLNKQTYTKWKLNPNNIMLGLPQEHENQNIYELFNHRHQYLKSLYNSMYNGKFAK